MEPIPLIAQRSRWWNVSSSRARPLATAQSCSARACSAWVSSVQPISMTLSVIFHVPSTLRSVSWYRATIFVHRSGVARLV